MNHCTRFFFVVVLCAPTGFLHAKKRPKPGKLAGQWEIQSLGSDRAVEIQHWGRGFTAIRVINAITETEESYRLEHRFKGRVSGKAVTGQLRVKEGTGRFETLRNFTASIEGPDTIVLDGMTLRRVVPEPVPTEAPPPTERVVAAPPPPPGPPGPPGSLSEDVPAQPVAAPPEPEPVADPWPEMSDEVRELVERGDASVKEKRYRRGLGAFDEGLRKGGPRAFLLHRIGKTFIEMGRKDRARRALKNALKADPNDASVRGTLDSLD